ncbi:hypothetical protein [Nonomuraea turcica]|uniref:hypothetical protein n=1 Tax=Nonomuraea sp. G32 TaxID=3067274 RepID=UPI00273BB3AA|nr:hypothetical protein [Nonomuraea sp. G32]MDP4502655.1 hypothetical protein [Nonomuraea sp. G32]
MDRIDTVKVPKSLPRPAAAADVVKVLTAICSRRPRKETPLDRLRDRVLFEAAGRSARVRVFAWAAADLMAGQPIEMRMGATYRPRSPGWRWAP